MGIGAACQSVGFHRSAPALKRSSRLASLLIAPRLQAWDVEHNFMHHYELGEASDPDLVERNTHRRGRDC
jgi:hypothetical protein